MNSAPPVHPLFKAIAFILYPARDPKASRAFYEGTLGLKETAAWGNDWIEYDIGSGTLVIARADEKHQAGRHGPTVGLEVVDFDTTFAHLKQAGVTIVEGPFDSPACRGCIIADPDGNEIIVHAKK
jgi:catechol 2,3-dioxygenase-like lactoylglutathione lyase family enzyme